jgi:hypothetical protein
MLCNNSKKNNTDADDVTTAVDSGRVHKKTKKKTDTREATGTH